MIDTARRRHFEVVSRLHGQGEFLSQGFVNHPAPQCPNLCHRIYATVVHHLPLRYVQCGELTADGIRPSGQTPHLA